MEKLKVALIDDETIVLKGIAAILRREVDLELVGTADNGLEGLALVLKEKPEIILTDIRMPGMSGLELIRKAKEALPDSVFIIFSGYNEFRYVKEAMGLGVIDYLEKPVTVGKLREAIDKGIQIYNYRQSYAEMSKNTKKAEKAYVERALRQVYEQNIDEEEYMKQVLSHNDQLEYAREVFAAVIGLRHEKSIESNRSIVQELVFDLLQDQAVEGYFFYEHDNIVLTYFNLGKTAFPFLESIREGKQRLLESGVECYIGVSRIHPDFYQIRNAYIEADDALRYARYLEERELVSIDAVEYANAAPKDLKEDQNSIGFNFRVGQYDLCRKQFADYLHNLKELGLIPELFQQKGMELLFSMKRMLDEMDQHQVRDLDLVHPKNLDRMTADEFASWLLSKLDLILEAAREEHKDGSNQAVSRLKRYIEEHFQEGITLDILAEQVHMSPTYLSMLFKREEGITYLRYLTRVRMEKAMGYIRQGYKAKQVCEMVGYYDYKHFSTQFKGYTGMSPDAYRKKMGT